MFCVPYILSSSQGLLGEERKKEGEGMYQFKINGLWSLAAQFHNLPTALAICHEAAHEYAHITKVQTISRYRLLGWVD